MPAEFEKWLSQELHGELDPLAARASTPHPWYRRLTMQSWSRPLSLLPVAAVRALVLAGGIAALSTTGTFALAAAVTHSPNPVTWGRQVESAVESCKQGLASGQQGIGGCVSDFAQTPSVEPESTPKPHGSPTPEATESSHPEGGSGSGNDEASHGSPAPESSSHPEDGGAHSTPAASPSSSGSTDD